MNYPVCDYPGCSNPVDIPSKVRLEPPNCWSKVAKMDPRPVQGWQGGFFFRGYEVIATCCLDHKHGEPPSKAVKPPQTTKEPSLYELMCRSQEEAIRNYCDSQVLRLLCQDYKAERAERRAKQRVLYEKWTKRSWPVDYELDYFRHHAQHGTSAV